MNINNKIKQSALCCIYCGKSYKTRTNLDKHLILCEIYHKSKTNNHTNDDEMNIIPSQKNMYQIIIELTLKCNRLENKVNELSKNILEISEKLRIHRKKLIAIYFFDDNYDIKNFSTSSQG